MKILIVIPPMVPSYFNAGHHLPAFQVAAYLRRQPDFSSAEMRCVDLQALNATWRDACTLLIDQPDVIAILDDLDAADGIPRFVRYARELAPRARIVSFGRLSALAPDVLASTGVHGIVESGDYEAGVAGFIRAANEGDHAVPGIRWLDRAGARPAPGLWLDPVDWAFPDIDEVPYEDYERLYVDDRRKFCGIPERRELVVPVARGCPVGCSFCDVPKVQGMRDRRVSVERTVAFIVDAFARRPFDYVSFYAPTFTLRRQWVTDLCARLEAEPRRYPWKCATTIAHLDEELLGTMARSGCVRVSVGVETIGRANRAVLPRAKHDDGMRLEALGRHCRAVGIELNCFVIAGLTGDRFDDVERTIAKVLEVGGRVRPTVYAPYDLFHQVRTVDAAAALNRQLFVGPTPCLEERARLYRLLYANGADRPSRVMTQIPSTRAGD
ncbi:MAG: radical SAM protein [Kofleriaceae bacterium]